MGRIRSYPVPMTGPDDTPSFPLLEPSEDPAGAAPLSTRAVHRSLLTEMPCSANARTQLTPADRARYVADRLPPHLFRSVAGPDVADPGKVAWRISPEPFPLTSRTVAVFEQLGGDLLRFYRAANKLYAQSVKGQAPDFIRLYLEQGKPDNI